MAILWPSWWWRRPPEWNTWTMSAPPFWRRGSWQTPSPPAGTSDPDRLARTYASPQDPRALPQDTLGIVGTGGIYATAADLASFGGLLCGTELLSQASLDAMTADWAARGLWPEDSADDQLGYGLGWDNVHMFPLDKTVSRPW
ncbi:MAG: serine hydrolase [Intestinimonas sp.]